MDYFVYFISPVLLALLGRKLLGQRFRVFALGLCGFLLAWTITQAIAGLSLTILQLGERSFIYAAIISVSGGFFEEGTRFLLFSRSYPFEGNRNARSSFMYALGHHGMETLLIGLTLAVMIFVTQYHPEVFPDGSIADRYHDIAGASSIGRLYSALERVSVGLLVQVCFSGVVMLGVIRHDRRWLVAAMVWHSWHNLVGYGLRNASAHWITERMWIAAILLIYTFAAMRIYRALNRTEPTVRPTGTPSAGILPGRS